ncbi:hypothetical protein LJC13_00660 [Peptostreptococcaceae bacterium OttesenSCG-928-C18]|nr:hypothetical protein [Peptostreptococcaceae bacterium OttesenSCG-928-C18]
MNLENMMNWFRVKLTQNTCYSQVNRLGNPCYDCSSSVYFALRAGGFVSSTAMGNTTTLQTLLPNIATKISRSECKYGDIFLMMNGTRGNHTGVFKNNSTIWHTTKSGSIEGVVETPASGWMGNGTITYWRLKGTEEEIDFLSKFGGLPPMIISVTNEMMKDDDFINALASFRRRFYPSYNPLITVSGEFDYTNLKGKLMYIVGFGGVRGNHSSSINYFVPGTTGAELLAKAKDIRANSMQDFKDTYKV